MTGLFRPGQQPVFAAKLRSVLHRWTVRTRRTSRIADLEALEGLGASRETYAGVTHDRCWAVGWVLLYLAYLSMVEGW